MIVSYRHALKPRLHANAKPLLRRRVINFTRFSGIVSIQGIVSSTLPSSTTITSQGPPVLSWNSLVAKSRDGNISSKSIRPFHEGITMLTDGGAEELIQGGV